MLGRLEDENHGDVAALATEDFIFEGIFDSAGLEREVGDFSLLRCVLLDLDIALYC
jgi:hypothetical protein